MYNKSTLRTYFSKQAINERISISLFYLTKTISFIICIMAQFIISPRFELYNLTVSLNNQEIVEHLIPLFCVGSLYILFWKCRKAYNRVLRRTNLSQQCVHQEITKTNCEYSFFLSITFNLILSSFMREIFSTNFYHFTVFLSFRL